MITEEHFDTLRRMREEAANLRSACIELEMTGSLLHIACDPSISPRPTAAEDKLLRHLRAVQ